MMNKDKIKNIVLIALTAILLIGAAIAYEPPVVTDNEQHGLIIVDAGEWGEVLPYTPDAPIVLPTAPGPTQQPTSSGDPTATPDLCPSPEFTWLEVVLDRAPLREIDGYNKKGAPIFSIYGKSNVSARYVAKSGKLLCAWAKPITGDGGSTAFRLISSQIVDGRYLPGDQYLYVLTRMVVVSRGLR